MSKNKNFLIGFFSIVGAATLWSLDGILFRPQFYQFPAINVVFLEHFLGAIILSPFIITNWKIIKKMTIPDLLSLFWVCFFGGLIGTLAITQSYFAAFTGTTTLATIIILQKLQPIFALSLAAIFLKEKLSKSFYFWASLAIVSAYFVAFGGFSKEVFNVQLFSSPAFLSIIAAFAFGSSTVFGKKVVDSLGYKVTTSLRFTFTAFLSFFLLLLFGSIGEYYNFGIIHYELILIIVLFTGTLGLFLYYYGLKKVKASQSTIFELAWPVSAIIFDYVFNKNVLSMTEIFASFVLILCFFMIIRTNNINNI